MAQGRDIFGHCNEPSGSTRGATFIDQPSDYMLLEKYCLFEIT
jgi:hypothetical protein